MRISLLHDYELSTFSFEHGVRDDGDRSIAGNDWDLSYGNSPDVLDVQMTGGDDSLIANLGPWSEAGFGARPRLVTTPSDRTMALFGQGYRVHTEDTNTDLWFEFVVLEQAAKEWVILAWQPVKEGDGWGQ